MFHAPHQSEKDSGVYVALAFDIFRPEVWFIVTVVSPASSSKWVSWLRNIYLSFLMAWRSSALTRRPTGMDRLSRQLSGLPGCTAAPSKKACGRDPGNVGGGGAAMVKFAGGSSGAGGSGWVELDASRRSTRFSNRSFLATSAAFSSRRLVNPAFMMDARWTVSTVGLARASGAWPADVDAGCGSTTSNATGRMACCCVLGVAVRLRLGLAFASTAGVLLFGAMIWRNK